jgi:hypothetical protein
MGPKDIQTIELLLMTNELLREREEEFTFLDLNTLCAFGARYFNVFCITRD